MAPSRFSEFFFFLCVCVCFFISRDLSRTAAEVTRGALYLRKKTSHKTNILIFSNLNKWHMFSRYQEMLVKFPHKYSAWLNAVYIIYIFTLQKL